MRKWVVMVIILIVAFLSYNYIYQDHRDIKREQSEYVLTSIDISNEFEIEFFSFSLILKIDFIVIIFW